MNDKLKKIVIPFILMMIFNLGIYYLTNGENYNEGLVPHVGILLISGLLLGPYGAIGAVIGNFLCDLFRGYNPLMGVTSGIISFGVSYLSYKLWYNTYWKKTEVTEPRLDTISNVLLFIAIIIICGLLYTMLTGKLFYVIYPESIPLNRLIEVRYILNFINFSFVFGIIGIWISNRFNIMHIPKTSKKHFNEKLYKAIGILLIILTITTIITDIIYFYTLNKNFVIFQLIVITLILFIYLRKPIDSNIEIKNSKSITESIMNRFYLSTLFIIIIGFIVSYNPLIASFADDLLPLNRTEVMISMMLMTDVVLIIFFIPSLVVLRYIEKKVIEPILSFSKIEAFIHENEKIESDGLINIYSKYIGEKTEIGTLARSYTDLIKFNNHYIENINEIEGEKERIKAELDIAARIQASNLPKEAIETNNYIVDGYSKPAKEVGGDFFDYYEVDEDNIAIIIGDASGKGIPAAILAMKTQVLIKQLLKYDNDPSKILYLLNNQLSENNTESLFITLWLGIYNIPSKKLVFSNGGHEPPLIKNNGKYEYLSIDSGLVLGIIEDFDFVKEKINLSDEIVLFTDGITDANNKSNQMYGMDNLLNFFNNFNNKDNLIISLLKDINDFTQDYEQFDDMTLLYLKIKND